MLNVEAELRETGWQAIERLCALTAGREGPLDERVVALPDLEFVEAARILLALGWLDHPGDCSSTEAQAE